MDNKPYRISWCLTPNPLGETAGVERDSIRDVIDWCVWFRAHGEKTSAGYSVYALDENGGFAETLLNWQRDGENTFGFLFDPNDPDVCFAASPADVPLCVEGDELEKLFGLDISAPGLYDNNAAN